MWGIAEKDKICFIYLNRISSTAFCLCFFLLSMNGYHSFSWGDIKPVLGGNKKNSTLQQCSQRAKGSRYPCSNQPAGTSELLRRRDKHMETPASVAAWLRARKQGSLQCLHKLPVWAASLMRQQLSSKLQPPWPGEIDSKGAMREKLPPWPDKMVQPLLRTSWKQISVLWTAELWWHSWNRAKHLGGLRGSSRTQIEATYLVKLGMH